MALPETQTFFSHYPKEVKEILRFVCQYEIELCLVGGAVRDFYLNKEFSKDHDFEIQAQESLKEGESLVSWGEFLDGLFKELQTKFQVRYEKLNMGVHRLFVNDFELEFSSARLEKYPSDKKAYGHSDFQVELYPRLSHEKAWTRRDFTINAMGHKISFPGPRSQVELIDPFDGLSDLQKKLLHPVGKDFAKDPVRFVRTLRFQRRFDFALSTSLKNRLKQFDLSLLSFHALHKEAHKDPRPIIFLKDFYEWTNHYSINLSAALIELGDAAAQIPEVLVNSIPDKNWILRTLWKTPYENSLSFSEYYRLGQWLNLKKRFLKRHYDFYVALHSAFSDSTPKDYTVLEGESLLRHPQIGQLKKIYDFVLSKDFHELQEAFKDLESSFIPWPLNCASIDSQKIKAQLGNDLSKLKGPKRWVKELQIFLRLWEGSC